MNTFRVLKKQEGPLKASGPKKMEKKLQITTKNGQTLKVKNCKRETTTIR